MEEIRRIGAGRREKGEIIMVKMKNKKMKRRIVRDKWKLKGDEVWIEEDLKMGRKEDKMEIETNYDKGGMEGKKDEVGGKGI